MRPSSINSTKTMKTIMVPLGSRIGVWIWIGYRVRLPENLYFYENKNIFYWSKQSGLSVVLLKG